MSNSHFDEKSGVISHKTDFGQWYQTVDEVMILVNLESGTRGKEVLVDIQPNKVKCVVRGKIVLEASTYKYAIIDPHARRIIVHHNMARDNLYKSEKMMTNTYYHIINKVHTYPRGPESASFRPCFIKFSNTIFL